MVSSMKGIGIKNCDNCLNEEQTADVNDIPTIRNNVEQTQEDLGALAENLDNEFDNVYGSIVQVGDSVKSWIEIPYETYSEYEPYKTKILNGDILKYDIIIVMRDSTPSYSSNFIGKNINISSYNISNITYKRSTISGTTYIFSECGKIAVKNLLTTDGTITVSKTQIGFSDDENNTILKTTGNSSLSRDKFKIYIFANENDLED